MYCVKIFFKKNHWHLLQQLTPWYGYMDATRGSGPVWIPIWDQALEIDPEEVQPCIMYPLTNQEYYFIDKNSTWGIELTLELAHKFGKKRHSPMFQNMPPWIKVHTATGKPFRTRLETLAISKPMTLRFCFIAGCQKNLRQNFKTSNRRP